jgi:hypothetical protein
MAKRQFSKVSPAIWASRKFRGVSSLARNFLLYLITNEHIDSSGCYRLPDAYAAHDFGVETDEIETLYAELVEADLISRDKEAEWVLIKRWFKHNPPTNESHATGTRKLISQIESDTLREETETVFEDAIATLEGQLAEKNARKAERGGQPGNGRSGGSDEDNWRNSRYGRDRE